MQGKRIVLGVTGGIAAYKACDLASRLMKRGAQVRVVMTKNACEFVCPLTFETLTGNPAYTDSFERKYEIEHVALAKWADLFIVAPATANCMAKFANGIADDLLSTTFLAMTCPVLIAPAMNSAMWRNPVTQNNLQTLTDRNVRFVGPESGRLACGDDDIGRMSEPETVADAADEILKPKNDLKGLRVLVTAGPTVEHLDPVRYITNRSTGKMGYAIAEAARNRGAEVTLVSGPVQIAPPNGVKRISIESSAELCAAVLENAGNADLVIQAAAPADFTPETVSNVKIKKTGDDMVLRLKSTTDIAAELGRRKGEAQTLVAFAAETNDCVENARKKLVKKNADLVVLNDVSRTDAGFGVDTNVITLITKSDVRAYEKMSKRAAADVILDCALELMRK